jgi:hypothetical protein
MVNEASSSSSSSDENNDDDGRLIAIANYELLKSVSWIHPIGTVIVGKDDDIFTFHSCPQVHLL